MFDAHCHLQDERIMDNADELLDRAAAAGIRYFMCCGIAPSDWADVAFLTETYDAVWPAYGVHPWYVQACGDDWFNRLVDRLTANGGSAGVGEIGLDHALSPRNDAVQAEFFVRQLRLARDLRRPVSIHCRKAWGAMVDILTREGGLPHGGVIHSYSGGKELVPVLEKLGCYLSFSGSLTRTRNKRGRAACLAVSLDRLLIETDAPAMLPAGATGPHNLPENLIPVLETLSALRKTAPAVLADLTCRNALRLFKGASP
ncbi:MAG: hypothetical protein CSA22_02175 [Deltaproteobacteria bacterium]|nr:MAG: hypothetical protein CSA22_02175 [Deltaproteobacteria bacterium]